jgi:hypothetical protein
MDVFGVNGLFEAGESSSSIVLIVTVKKAKPATGALVCSWIEGRICVLPHKRSVACLAAHRLETLLAKSRQPLLFGPNHFRTIPFDVRENRGR